MSSFTKSSPAGRVLLTPVQAAELLGTTPGALRVRRMRGSGPPYVDIGGRVYRYPADALESWIAARLVDPSAAARAQAAAALS